MDHVLAGSNPVSGSGGNVMSWIDYVLVDSIYCTKCHVPLLADVNLLCRKPFEGSPMTCPKCGIRVEQEYLPGPKTRS